MSAQTPTAFLYEIMTKKGITPYFRLVNEESKTKTHINQFLIRLTCPIEPNGSVYVEEGWGLSKKEAKHNAALVFIQKHLQDGNNNPSINNNRVVAKSAYPNCVVNTTEQNSNAVLQDLCMKFNLGNPEYDDVVYIGPPHARNYTVACRISNFGTVGQGSTKKEAKSQATTKMIQRVMDETNIETFKSPILTRTSNSNEIICLNENLTGLQLQTPIGTFARRKSSTASCNTYPASDRFSVRSPGAIRMTNTKDSVLALSNSCHKVEDIVESSEDSSSNASSTNFADDLQQKIAISKARSKSMTSLLECGKSEDKCPNCNDKLTPNLTILSVTNKIDATLESVVKQLYDEILDNLVYRGLPHQKTVTILSHEYIVFVNRGCCPKIFEGNSECTDASIKIASLSKVLIDLKNHVQRSGKKINK